MIDPQEILTKIPEELSKTLEFQWWWDLGRRICSECKTEYHILHANHCPNCGSYYMLPVK